MPKDNSLYRITYDNGKVKHGHRRVLGPVLAYFHAPGGSWCKKPVRIERVPDPEWEDVTDEFL